MDNDRWWTEADLERATRFGSMALLRAHRHDNPILGEPLTRLMATGLVKCKPQLDRRGRPLSWMVQVTRFGQAVREYVGMLSECVVGMDAQKAKLSRAQKRGFPPV